MLVQVAPICQRGGLNAGTATAATTTGTTECPYGWETYTGDGSLVKCFKHCGDQQYATHAEQYCQAQGGHLASIHSSEEQNFLMQTFGLTDDIWIGAVDTDHNGAWEWTDGSTFDFSNWVSGQPDGKQYYAYMDCNDSPSGQWKDYYYNVHQQYICQITL